jgi:hypothetical protein
MYSPLEVVLMLAAGATVAGGVALAVRVVRRLDGDGGCGGRTPVWMEPDPRGWFVG